MGANFGFNTSFSDINTGLFGNDTSGSGSGTGSQTGTKSSTDTGQTATTTTGGSTNTSTQNTVNSGTTNTQTTSGSTNVITNSGGKNTSTTRNSGRDDYTQTLLSNDALMHLVNQALESTSGLASLVSGQKGAGAYNTTTTALLGNDLLSRISGEVAVRGARTVSHIGESSSTTDTEIGATTQTQQIGGTKTISDTGPSSSYTTGTQNIAPTTSTTVTGPRTITENASSNTSQTTNQSNESKGLLDWIVCTELRAQGRMSLRDYTCGGKKFLQYPETVLRGYYFWAPRAVRELRTNPNSFISNFLEYIFNHRARSYVPNKATLWNKTIAASVYLVCWTLSRTVARDTKYVREEKSYG